jgi:hypothetical protein
MYILLSNMTIFVQNTDMQAIQQSFTNCEGYISGKDIMVGKTERNWG